MKKHKSQAVMPEAKGTVPFASGKAY